MPSPTFHRTPAATDLANSIQSSDDDCADLRRVLEEAARSARDLHHSAARARRDNDHELAWFFERCAASDELRCDEVKELLGSRTRLSTSEMPTSAAFAAGDGADDADVSPNTRRGRIGIWPAL